MKKILFSIIGLLLFSTAYSQKINYQKSFDQAAAKARAENKLLFVAVTSPLPPVATRPEHFVYRTGIDDPEVIKLFNKNFVSYTIQITDTASNSLRKKCQLHSFPAYLFI